MTNFDTSTKLYSCHSFSRKDSMKHTSNVLQTIYQRNNPIPDGFTPEKKFEELNLMDSFLFESATEKTENAILLSRVVIERVLGRKVGHLTVQSQKDLKGVNTNQHGIRMDLYTAETKSDTDEEIICVYDIEPNNYRDDMPRRNRYYQSLVDSKLLPSGLSYDKLPDLFSIWILPYDPFGDNRMIYTVKNIVVENDQIVHNDGVTKAFLYTGGCKGGSKELKNLLTFMETSDRSHAVDEELSKIMDIIETVKSSPEELKRYMGIMSVIDYEKRDAYLKGEMQGEERGRSEGLIAGILGSIQMCHSLGIGRTTIKEKIMEQFTLDESKAEEYLTLYWNEENKTTN